MRHRDSEQVMLALNVGYVFLHGKVDLTLSNNHGSLSFHCFCPALMSVFVTKTFTAK